MATIPVDPLETIHAFGPHLSESTRGTTSEGA